jgi:beta-lactamase regulating signal transducer with metallopeptidase domain
MLAADDRVARKVLHVISLSPGEHQWLQTKVAELSKKLAIASPKIGVVEDLRPNAFTIGYGENSTIVFSIGLINILDREEIVAVATHELAHVKNHDFFYKTLTSALTVVSFFNPLAYIVSSTGQREREMYADERAIELSEKPAALGNALAKICKAIQSLPKESILISFSSNLLVTSSVLHRLGILSTHPRLDKRLRNISEPRSRIHLNHRRAVLAVSLTLLLVCSAIAVSFAMVDLQTGFASVHQGKPQDIGTTAGYGVVGASGMLSSGSGPVLSGVGQTVNASSIQMSPGLNNANMMVIVNNGSSPNAQVIVVNGSSLSSQGNLPVVP